jgi:histidine triad (HIT) family protein
MRDPSCIFCKIVAGEIPSMRIYEDEATLAFLDIGPLAEGHLLIIPRSHYEFLDEMPATEVAAVTSCLPRLAKAVASATQAGGYNILQNNGKLAGQAVGHVHFHIIPRRDGDGLGYRWPAGKYEPGRAEQVRTALLGALG